MRLRDTLQSAVFGVTVNKRRSLLTMLGIIIGIAAVVLMSAIGESMKGVILSQISSLGPKSMVIFPGQQEGGPNAVATGYDSLTFEDYERLRQLTTIETVAPVIFIPGRVTYGNEESSSRVFGVLPEFFQNQNIFTAQGRLLEQSDIDGAKYVAVLGPDAADKLFGSLDPVGKRFKVGDRSYTVVGITKPLGSQFFQNADDRVYAPFTVARDVTGQKYINYITMKAVGSFDLAFDDVKSLLRLRHNIDNPEDDPKKDDFVVRSSQQASQILGGVSMGLTLFITMIAAISLIVGGIGIMNIMLVSVSERTQEIGLRKAIGAKKRDVLLQFLIEAVFLTAIGGCFGIVLGLGGAYVISLIVKIFLASYTFAVSPLAIAASLLMAALTGLVFGLNPARRAAQLSPMEALRYE